MAETKGPADLPRALRRASTDAEKRLWQLLRDRRLAKMKWRRQVRLGRYIVDFLCYRYRLVVECDGSHHAGSVRDEIRDAWLREQGFAVIRFWNHEIAENPVGVTDTILAKAGLPF